MQIHIGIGGVIAFAWSFFHNSFLIFFVFFVRKKKLNLLTADPLRSEHPPKHVVDLEWTGGR